MCWSCCWPVVVGVVGAHRGGGVGVGGDFVSGVEGVGGKRYFPSSAPDEDEADTPNTSSKDSRSRRPTLSTLTSSPSAHRCSTARGQRWGGVNERCAVGVRTPLREFYS